MIAARPPQPPIWLLGIDGVINVPHPEAVWDGPPLSGRAVAGVDSFTLTWAPRLLARIREIALTGAAEIQWVSAWCGQTRRLEEMWGLPELVDAFDAFNATDVRDVEKLKYAAAHDALLRGRRVIWTDRDVPHRNDPPCELSVLAAARDTVIIAPSPDWGLTPDHMHRIEAFCAMEAN